jgi:NADH dehydrogenase
METRGTKNAAESLSFDGALIVGGGYAGLHAATALQRADVPVSVLDADSTHGFITRLASVAAGSAPEGDAFAPFRELGFSVAQQRVHRVDDGRVTLDDDTVIEASSVIIATGSVAAKPPVPGIEHAETLRTTADALALRRKVAAAEEVLIVGGGATGVQLAGEVALANQDTRVRLVEEASVLLASYGRRLGLDAWGTLTGRGVLMHLGQRVERIDSSGLVLESGRRLDGLVVWAGGFRSVGTVFGDHLPLSDGRIDVGSDLRVRGWKRTFAAGDVAAHLDGSGDVLPMSAQIAVQAGTGAGQNASRLFRGRPARPVALRQRGWVLDLGGGRGVADLGGVELVGPLLGRLAPVVHTAIDVKNLLEIGGLGGLRFLPGAHRPRAEATPLPARGHTRKHLTAVA